MSLNLKKLKLLLFLTTFNSVCLFAQPISKYRIYFGTTDNNLLVLRTFYRGSQSFYLAADVATLTARVYPAAQLKVTPGTLNQSLLRFNNSAYNRAITTAQQQSTNLQDAGISHGFPKEKGISLTIDLCPSHKPLDRVIFTSLINAFKKVKTPVPVALSNTGRFMLTHGEDIEWLKGLQKAGDLEITWINHTYNHHFNPKIPLKDNFLLEPGTDVNFEVLGTETAMLQHGLVPSVFFRFPGLISDHTLVDQITGYGLIPVGSDAWLAKGQNAASGSIVLIHGNGNEPVGIKDFIKLLATQTPEITNKQWLLYDLSETVEDEFSPTRQ
jgi:hypothetical protein